MSLALFPGIVNLYTLSPEQLVAIFAPTSGEGPDRENEADREGHSNIFQTSFELLDQILPKEGTIPVLFISMS